MEERRKVILREMEAELKATEEQKTKHIRSHASTMRVIEQLRSGVESLFNKSGCDGSAILEMLGGSAGVSDSNLLQYLGLIEQRANELLQLHSFVHVKESNDPASMATFLQGRAPKHQGGPVTVTAPSTVDNYDSDDASIEEEGKPLTQDELRMRLSKKAATR